MQAAVIFTCVIGRLGYAVITISLAYLLLTHGTTIATGTYIYRRIMSRVHSYEVGVAPFT